MSTDPPLKRTPIFEEHVALGGKMVPFAGYELPVQYPSGITAEHAAVRNSVGLFDVSHMGEFEVEGPQALDLIQHIGVNDASNLDILQAQYSAMCREDGGIIDDMVVYRFADRFMLVVNGACRAKDWAWLERHAAGFDVEIRDRSDDFGMIAVQGPAARVLLAPHTETDLGAIGYYRCSHGAVAGVPSVISRTGYTGEDGFELYVPSADAAGLWRTLLDGEGASAAGLGARDSLRLEMGFALYGNDLDEEHTPLEGRLGWLTKLDKGDFVGRDALLAQKETGVARRLVGLRLTERGFPRPGYPIVGQVGRVGSVTSGTVSPTLGVGIAMGYVAAEFAAAGTELAVSIRHKTIPAVIERPPFYTDGSLKR
ncbi:MAG: glycine cleavage system aminomethyltransferase GcvT [Gemmatimonadota bacterium]|nr:MAG: glycine cleavage system aminomethyltransferase GcvT [Gemmatimonadota bacterium]